MWWFLIHSLLVWTETIDLSSLPPLQSSVDHKEFKRCGPFDPYINAKVCTQCCRKQHFFLKRFLALLLCWPAVLVAAAVWGQGSSAAQLSGAFMLSQYMLISAISGVSPHVLNQSAFCWNVMFKVGMFSFTFTFIAKLFRNHIQTITSTSYLKKKTECL